MGKFKVLVHRPSGAGDITLLVADDLFEAEAFAATIAQLKPWVVDDDSPGTVYSLRGSVLRRETPPQLDRNARQSMQAIYLDARAELANAGVPQSEIDRMMPLTADGNVP